MRSQETDALVQHDSELQNGYRFSTDFQNTTSPPYFDTWSQRVIRTISPREKVNFSHKYVISV